MSDLIAANKRRALLLVSVEVAVATVVLGVVGGLLLGWWAFLPVFVLVVVVALVLARLAPATVLRRVGGRPADPARHARLDNLTSSLCAAAGLPKPALVVIDDPAPNALVCGRDPRSATLVVTQGLLDKLSRIELEGVLAHELSHVKAYDILPGTLAAVFAAPFGAAAVDRVLAAGRETAADVSGVTITRYPPGLLSALQHIESDGTAFQPASRTTAHLWLRPPGPADVVRRTFDERIEALREL